MTVSSERPPTLPLRLTALQTPAAVTWMQGVASLAAPVAERDRPILLLTPGQTSELAVQIENYSSQDISWKLQVRGEAPDSWCLWRQEEPEILVAGDRLQSQICFQVPEHWFEQPHLLAPGEVATLAYPIEIHLYALHNGEWQLAGYEPFQLSVQPFCQYLDYLPEIYQTSDFMGRFLNIFEQGFDPTLQTMDAFWAYLDPLTAPRSLLPFLSHWVAWKLDPRWDLKRQRRLLRHAVELYRLRGTREGLRLYLHLYTDLPLEEPGVAEGDRRISIVENFETGFVLGQASLQQNPMLGGGRPYHFSVTLRPDDPETLDQALIRDVIEQVKPAFCTYDLQIMHHS